MIYLPILGAFLESTGLIIEKKVLKIPKIKPKDYLYYMFIFLAIVMIPFSYFFWEMKPEALEPKNILIFLSIVIISIIANFLVIYALKKEEVTEIENIRLTQPLLTVLLAFLFSFFSPHYLSERNYSILGLALIASFALIISHIEKNKISFDKYAIATFLGSFFFALELVLSNFLLIYYSSFTFYFIRCTAIALILAIIVRPRKDLESNYLQTFLILGIIWTVNRVIIYYGYQTLGIAFTTMLFILAPVFIYISARIFLKEKIKLKQIISSLIIIACVIIAIFLN